MRFDSVLYLLMDWCANCSAKYREAYRNGSEPVGYISYRTADELRFKLASMLEQDYDCYASFAEQILDFLDIRYDPFLQKLQNETQRFRMERVKRDFRAYFETLGPESCGTVPAHYARVILGDAAEQIIFRFRNQWDYAPQSHWYPITNHSRGEMLYLMQDFVEAKERELRQLLGLPEQRMYCWGERDYRIEYVMETDDLIVYSGLECAYTDKDFTWLIYCSHEQTVTFAGCIVPKVRELFAAEEKHWDRFVWGMD